MVRGHLELFGRNRVNQATQTTKTITLAPASAASRQPVLRRKCACGQHTSSGECEECKKKKESTESEDPLLRRSAFNRNRIGEVPNTVHNAIRQQGQPLDRSTRTRLESGFHCDLSRVRVHSDESAARAANDINARAFTLGQNIWFGRNEFSPQSQSGFHLLAHEVAHTVQQGTQTPIVQRSLSVGAADDPAEAAADRAADAIVGSAPIPRLFGSQLVVRRQAKFPLVEDLGPDEKRVSLDEHTRYRVKRTAEPVRHTKGEKAPPKVGVDADFAKAWIQVEWCQDAVRGHAELGVDITKQLEDLIPKLLRAVVSNSGQDATNLLKNSTVTPYLKLIVAQSGNWQFNFKAQVDVGQGGVTSGGGSLNVNTSWGDISLRVDVTQTPGGTSTSGSLVFTIPLGKTTPTFTCKDKVTEWWEKVYFYTCTKEPEPDKPKSDVPAKLDPLVLPVYFCYSTAELNDDICAKSPADPRRKSYEKLGRDFKRTNAETKSALRSLFDKGYSVSKVVGFTSIEGPIKPGPGFEGNQALSDDRAKAGLEFAIGPGREKGVELVGAGPEASKEPDYPQHRRAEIHLVPPTNVSAGQSDTKKPDLFKRLDFSCPPNVQDLAFPPDKETKK